MGNRLCPHRPGREVSFGSCPQPRLVMLLRHPLGQTSGSPETLQTVLSWIPDPQAVDLGLRIPL